jgi:hypothetical protein
MVNSQWIALCCVATCAKQIEEKSTDTKLNEAKPKVTLWDALISVAATETEVLLKSRDLVTRRRKGTAARRRGPIGLSKLTGVCVSRKGTWRAILYVNRKQIYLGVYATQHQAHRIYQLARRQAHKNL